jgi:hypothetical protein
LRHEPRDHAPQNSAAADLAHRLVAAAHPPGQPPASKTPGIAGAGISSIFVIVCWLA